MNALRRSYPAGSLEEYIATMGDYLMFSGEAAESVIMGMGSPFHACARALADGDHKTATEQWIRGRCQIAQLQKVLSEFENTDGHMRRGIEHVRVLATFDLVDDKPKEE